MRANAILLAFLLASVAGCVDGAPMGPSPSSVAPTGHVARPTDAATDDASLGSIVGEVLTEELVPIVGADVSLLDPVELSATSDESGAFEFRGLDAGTYSLQVSAVGHESAAKRFDVKPGEATQARILLKAVFVTEVYSSLFIDDGMWACDLAVVGSGDGCQYLDNFQPGTSGDKRRFQHPHEAGLTALVATATVKPNQVLSPTYLRVGAFSVYGSPGYFANGTHGDAPTTLRIAFEEAIEKASIVNSEARPTTPCNDYQNLGPCTSGSPNSILWVSLQQRFTLYTTLFYGGLYPEGYTGLPPG